MKRSCEKKRKEKKKRFLGTTFTGRICCPLFLMCWDVCILWECAPFFSGVLEFFFLFCFNPSIFAYFDLEEKQSKKVTVRERLDGWWRRGLTSALWGFGFERERVCVWRNSLWEERTVTAHHSCTAIKPKVGLLFCYFFCFLSLRTPSSLSVSFFLSFFLHAMFLYRLFLACFYIVIFSRRFIRNSAIFQHTATPTDSLLLDGIFSGWSLVNR